MTCRRWDRFSVIGSRPVKSDQSRWRCGIARVIAVLVGLAALLAVAAPVTADDPGFGYIRGYVQSENGLPAYGVCVSTGEYATDVQADGTYELQASYGASYHVYFYDCYSRPDYPYVTPWFWGGDDTYWSGDTISLEPGTVAYANVTLPPAPGSPPEFGLVTGVVTAEGDDFYPEELFYLISEDGAMYQGRDDPLGHVEGREPGRFIVSAPPGEYRLFTMGNRRQDTHIPVYYGDHPRGFSVLFDEGEKIQIRSGQAQTGLDFTLKTGRAVHGEARAGVYAVDIWAQPEHPGIIIETIAPHLLDRVALYQPDPDAIGLGDFYLMAFPGVPTIVPAIVKVLVREEMLGVYDADTVPVWLNHTQLEACETAEDLQCITDRYMTYGYVGMTAVIEVRTTTGGLFRLGERPHFYDSEVSTFAGDILWLADSGITKGCNAIGDLFCPEKAVTRGQMAAFLTRALGLTARLDDPFTDDDDSIFEADIERLAAAGITRGCNPAQGNTRFCPDEPVTRSQMAAFLVRALGYTDGAGSDRFTDDDGSIFEADIERLAEAGITKGCNPPVNDQFCPDAFVTRSQMAAFLHRALG